jgi:isopenicillin N synthase-like dioxygenase
MDNTVAATLIVAHNIAASVSVTPSTSRVAVVDFYTFLAGDGKKIVARQISDACEGSGFFYLINYGVVPRTAVDAIFAGADKADAPDLNESFKYQHELPEDYRDVVVNRWPEGLPGWRERLLDYYDRIEHLADALLRAFAWAKGRQFGLRPHSDTTAFTILAQSDVGGLQVRNGAHWIDVPPIPDSFVSNIGDMMARWSNDCFASTAHRVINRSGTERYSAAFFAIADSDAGVECPPSCTGPDNPPKYPPLRVGEFMLRSNATDWNKDLRHG